MSVQLMIHDPLARAFNDAIVEYANGGDVDIRDICIAACGIIGAYIEALSDPKDREMCVEAVCHTIRTNVVVARAQ